VQESHCSSLDKYNLGERSVSNLGIKSKCQDPTNNNATRRDIVFYTWERVSDEEVYPAGTPEGWGCPAFSNNELRAIDRMLKRNNKKTLILVIQ
jgi:hypothetical protein